MRGWRLASSSIALQLVAVIFFSIGFFPQPKSRKSHEHASIEKIVDDESRRCGGGEKPKHLVLVVVDALRYGFLDSMVKISEMLERDRRTTALRVHVHSPTVTLPRIKAMVSGTVPTFFDIVWNLASVEYTEDNWLGRARMAGRRVVFYGDDTWMKMFPRPATETGGVFEERSEGVSSFFVTDYTEVDKNVTRHIEREFNEEGLTEWEVMVLHYLGLDHVGHSLGGDHSQIRIKLAELDYLIVDIAQKLEASGEEFVLLVTGDHGMTEMGNHGGSSPHETEVPLVVIRPSSSYSTNLSTYSSTNNAIIEQIDLVVLSHVPTSLRLHLRKDHYYKAPTISTLLGLNPPVNSVGVSFLSRLHYSWHVVATGLRTNARGFAELMAEHLSEEDDASLRDCIREIDALCASTIGPPPEDREVLARCEASLKRLQMGWLDQVDSFDNKYIALGLSLSAAGLMLSIANLASGGYTLHTISAVPLLLSTAQQFLLFSSSYVEEEHDIWYFLLPLLVVHHAFVTARRAGRGRGRKVGATLPVLLILIVVLSLHRISRTYSESSRRRWKLFAGDKTIWWRGWNGTFESIVPELTSAELGSMLTSTGTPIVLTALLLLVFYIFTARGLRCSVPATICIAALCILKSPFFTLLRPNLIEMTVQLTIVWLGLFQEFSLLITLWLLFIAKTSVYPIVASCGLIGYAIGTLAGKRITVELAPMLYAAMASAFFYQGNTNDISTVDISAGYVGLTSYQPVLVAVQILLNTYLGPIAVFIGWYEAIRKHDRRREFLDTILSFLLAMRSSTMLVTMISLHFHRYHLFIHSVFAPKFLYEVAHFCTATLFLVLIKLRTGFG